MLINAQSYPGREGKKNIVILPISTSGNKDINCSEVLPIFKWHSMRSVMGNTDEHSKVHYVTFCRER